MDQTLEYSDVMLEFGLGLDSDSRPIFCVSDLDSDYHDSDLDSDSKPGLEFDALTRFPSHDFWADQATVGQAYCNDYTCSKLVLAVPAKSPPVERVFISERVFMCPRDRARLI